MARTQRTTTATAEQARLRLRSAQAYLEVADLVLDEHERVEMPGVAAGLAVLAGIAGSDAICASRLGVIHRGEDHRSAAAFLEEATPDGKNLAATRCAGRGNSSSGRGRSWNADAYPVSRDVNVNRPDLRDPLPAET